MNLNFWNPEENLEFARKSYESYPGWTSECPSCRNKKARTTRSACGCGTCIECGYRFCCLPPIDLNQIVLTIPPLKYQETKMNSPCKVNYKKLHDNAIPPRKAKKNDSGYDLHALNDAVVPSLPKLILRYAASYFNPFRVVFKRAIEAESNLTTKIPTGIALEVPEGHTGLICDRSGLGSKCLKSFGGVIDQGYVGDITVCLMNFSFFDYKIKAGDRIAQILFLPIASPELVEVDELTQSERGTAGFGSSGVRKEFHE